MIPISTLKIKIKCEQEINKILFPILQSQMNSDPQQKNKLQRKQLPLNQLQPRNKYNCLLHAEPFQFGFITEIYKFQAENCPCTNL